LGGRGGWALAFDGCWWGRTLWEDREWHRLRRLRLLTGTLIVLAIAAPWYLAMFAFPGNDDEGKTFFERFIVHDHFKRLVTGVYTSTPGGTFIYFIEQLGFDCFPWVFALPGALGGVLARRTLRPQTTRDRAPSGPPKAPLNAKPSPASSASDLALKQSAPQTPVSSPVVPRDKPERPPQTPSAAAASLAKHGQSSQATPRRREKKATQNDSDIVKRLQAICTDADPTRLYRNLVKIGQGCV